MTELITLLAVIVGYILGRFSKPELVIKEGMGIVASQAKQILRDKPKPGVVNRLTEEQIREKHSPEMQGTLDTMNQFFESERTIR